MEHEQTHDIPVPNQLYVHDWIKWFLWETLFWSSCASLAFVLKSNQAQGVGGFGRTVPGTLGRCYFGLSGGVKLYVVKPFSVSQWFYFLSKVKHPLLQWT